MNFPQKGLATFSSFIAWVSLHASVLLTLSLVFPAITLFSGLVWPAAVGAIALGALSIITGSFGYCLSIDRWLKARGMGSSAGVVGLVLGLVLGGGVLTLGILALVLPLGALAIAAAVSTVVLGATGLLAWVVPLCLAVATQAPVVRAALPEDVETQIQHVTRQVNRLPQQMGNLVRSPPEISPVGGVHHEGWRRVLQP